MRNTRKMILAASAMPTRRATIASKRFTGFEGTVWNVPGTTSVRPCHVVGSSIELTRRHHIAHERRDDDAAGEQDQRMREAQPRGLAHRGLEFIGHDFGD
jgi:hypothetical protein